VFKYDEVHFVCSIDPDQGQIHEPCYTVMVLVQTVKEMWTILRRYRIILPSEHGSWPLMLTPFVIGVGVARQLNAAALACAVAALSLFLLRQPIILWWRVESRKARASDSPTARFWALLLAVILMGSGTVLLALDRWSVLWLAIPAVLILVITSSLTLRQGTRKLLIEIIGSVGLALTAPAGYVASSGMLDKTTWVVWGIAATYSALSVLYVRLRVDDRHGRATQELFWVVIVAHGTALLLALVVGAAGHLPYWVALPFALLFIRALYVSWRKPPIRNIKRFGFAEMGVALVFAAVIIIIFQI
jgi:hypothetical protein